MNCIAMLLTITNFDGVPIGATEPLKVEILRQIAATDGSEYWLGKLSDSIDYPNNGAAKTVDYVIVGPGWAGTSFKSDFSDLRVNVAYVTDQSVLEVETLDFAKADYVGYGSGIISSPTGAIIADAQNCSLQGKG